MLRNWSLGATVSVGFASLLAMMAGLIALAVHEVDLTQIQRRVLAEDVLPAAASANRLAFQIARYDAALQGYLITRSSDDLATARQARDLARAAAVELHGERLSQRNDQALSVLLQHESDEFQQQAEQAELYAASSTSERAVAFAHQYLRGTVAEASATAERLAARLNARVIAIPGQHWRRSERLTEALILGFGLSGLVGILLAVYLVRLVTEPVARLAIAARAVEKGDYSIALHLGEGGERAGVSRENELSALARSFTHMASALEERECRLRSQTSSLAAALAQLTALQSLTDVALSDLALDSLLRQLLQRVVTGLGGQTGAIFLADEKSGRLVPCALLNLSEEDAIEETGCLEECAADMLGGSDKPMVCADLENDTRTLARCVARRGVRAYMAMALRLQNRLVGYAQVDFLVPQSFAPPSEHLMQVFGERVVWAVEHARVLGELEAWGRELERRVLQQQEQLLRSERLAAIGLIGGSIAHELRNPLGVISNSIYFLRQRLSTIDDKCRRHLEIIEREVTHSTQIINNLVDFSIGIEPMTVRLDLNTIVRTALEYTSVPKGITVETNLDPHAPSVVGDESQLLQVFEHLIRNAVQAMGDSGEIRITTGAREAAVWACVQDTGPGIPLEDQARVFEPLMTTRAKGMGLGLSLSRKILEAHDGELRLSSTPGNGAVFTVELPITDRLAPPHADLSSGRAGAAQQSRLNGMGAGGSVDQRSASDARG